MQVNNEIRELIIEIITNLANIKSNLAEFILEPSGIPPHVYGSLLYKRDKVTGRKLSKREVAPYILDEIEKMSNNKTIIRKMIEIASQWNNFHLAYNEYKARATVQKARVLLDNIQIMEAREEKQRELARKEELAQLEKERNESLKRESELLLMMFDDLVKNKNKQDRGFLLQDLLNRLFRIYDIPVINSFTRNNGGEQIDGAFKLQGWHYIVECRWRKKLSDIRELDGLLGQIDRSGKQTMGVYLSITGWSKNVVPLLKQNTAKSIILMDGYDLRTVLTGTVDLRQLIEAKIARLNLYAEPFYSVTDYIKQSESKVQ